MMKTLFEYSALCVLVWCAVAESGDNDVSNLQHVVGEILRRLDEKDVQIEKLQQLLAEQETLNAAQEKLNSEQNKLNAEQTIRLADQDAIIETLKNRLVMFEYESASPAEAMKTLLILRHRWMAPADLNQLNKTVRFFQHKYIHSDIITR